MLHEQQNISVLHILKSHSLIQNIHIYNISHTLFKSVPSTFTSMNHHQTKQKRPHIKVSFFIHPFSVFFIKQPCAKLFRQRDPSLCFCSLQLQQHYDASPDSQWDKRVAVHVLNQHVKTVPAVFFGQICPVIRQQSGKGRS